MPAKRAARSNSGAKVRIHFCPNLGAAKLRTHLRLTRCEAAIGMPGFRRLGCRGGSSCDAAVEQSGRGEAGVGGGVVPRARSGEGQGGGGMALPALPASERDKEQGG